MRINHTDPWVRSDAYRTSRTLGLQTTRSSGSAIHGRASDDVILRCAQLCSHGVPAASVCKPHYAACCSAAVGTGWPGGELEAGWKLVLRAECM